MKRSSLYQQLLLKITLTLFVGLIALSFINYKVNERKLEETNEWQRKIILRQVSDVMDIYDHGMDLFEKNFDTRMKNVSQQILNYYKGKTEELKKTDLTALRQEFNIDKAGEDLYIIDRNYTIVNTTFEKDLGLNFKKRNASITPFFDSIFSSSNCYVDRFTIERATGNFKKYCYQASDDKKIILEMGFFSNEGNKYRNRMEKKVKEIENLFPDINQIDLFMAMKTGVHFNVYKGMSEMYTEVVKDGKARRQEIKTQNGTEYIDMMFLPIQHSKMYKGYVIQIVSNDSQKRKLIYNEVKKSVLMFICTLLPLILILGYQAKKITKPIRILSEKSKIISRGKLDERIELIGNNEITELSENFNNMIEQLQESHENLENKVKARTAEVLEQKHIIEEKHKEITDSINYAERIQRSFLATKQILDENLSDYFVMFKPKDIVSGDFYWAGKLNNGNFAFVTADSTGHGVPGAIMSLLNITSLEKAIESLDQPSEILNSTRKTIIERLKKDGSEHGGKDGMDASLTVYDFKNKKLIIAAANNPVWIMRNSGTEAVEVIEVKPDKMPIGKHDKDGLSFNQQEINLLAGDVIYTLTDGFPDQFGGEKGKKYLSKNLRELLAANAHLSMNEQKKLLENTFSDWLGNLEQVDDVTIIGVRV